MPFSSGLCTIIKNPTANERIYSFIPTWMGNKLAAGETKNFPGDLVTVICADKETCERNFIAFQRSLIAGDIQILQTPSKILQDTSTGAIRELTLTGGTLGSALPGWDSTS